MVVAVFKGVVALQGPMGPTELLEWESPGRTVTTVAPALQEKRGKAGAPQEMEFANKPSSANQFLWEQTVRQWRRGDQIH